MDGFSILDELAWRPEYFSLHPAYQAGNALGWLYRGDKQAATQHPLAGRLYLAKSGWLLLSVPNALVRGLYDALTAPGAELPRAGVMNVPNVSGELLNAHISVMTADEVKKVGADKINERGHMFGYALGTLKEIDVRNVDGVSRVWALQVSSPGLAALRKSYGLSPLPNDHPFHITIAVRRKKVLQDNAVRKAASDDKLPGGEADGMPDSKFPTEALAEGTEHEHEHTDDDATAKEIAKDHLSEDARYYDKHKEAEQVRRPRIIDELMAAKSHSDAKRYDHKNDIVRRLMTQAPQDWHIDDKKKKYKGVTHRPTNFKLHVDPTVIPVGVKSANSVYVNQFQNMFNLRQPLQYDFDKPVFENIQNQLMTMKRRGDFMMQARRNNELYRSALDPQYRYQQALAAFEGRLPQPSMFDQAVERYGDGVIGMFGRRHYQ